MIVRINLDQVAEQKVLHSHSIAEMGCSTLDCEGEVANIALVEVKLKDGRTLNVTKLYCTMCLFAIQKAIKE